jgi:hypothetical protein
MSSIPEIRDSFVVPHIPSNIEYQERTVKTTIRVNDHTQYESVYTYDKYGRLIENVIRRHEIGVV